MDSSRYVIEAVIDVSAEALDSRVVQPSIVRDDTPLGDIAITASLLVALAVMPALYQLEGRIGTAAVLAVMLGWIVTRLIRGRDVGGIPLVPVWVILAGILVPVVLAVSPRFALEGSLVPLAALGVLTFFASGVLRRQAVLIGIAIAGVVVAILTLVDFGLQTAEWIRTMAAVDPNGGLGAWLPIAPPRASANPYLHPNACAPMLYVTLCVSVVLARLPGLRLLAWSSGILTAAALVATGSRSGMIGAFAGMCVTWVLLTEREGPDRKRRLRLVLIVAAAGLVGLVVLWLGGIRPDFVFRATFADRLPIMNLGLEMAADEPLLGHGPGAFRYLYPLYGPDLYPGIHNGFSWVHSHNAYVQSLIDFGVVGSVAIVGGLAALLAVAIRSARIWGATAVLAAGAATGTAVAVAVNSLSDVVYLHLGPSCFFAALVGVALANTRTPRKRWKRAERATQLLALALVPLIVALTLPAHISYRTGRQSVVTGDHAAAATQFSRSEQLDPLPVYQQVATFASVESGREVDFADDEALLPFLTLSVPLNLAAQAVESADPDAADGYLDAAEPLVAGDEAALVAYGLLRLEIGQEQDAIDAFTEAVLINPWLSDSPFLERLSPDIRADVSASAFEGSACWHGDEWVLNDVATSDQMNVIAQTCPSDSAAALMVMVRTGSPDQALEMAAEGLEGTPDSFQLRRVAGEAALELGLVDDARWHFAVASLLDDSFSAYRLSRTYPSGSAPSEVVDMVRRLSDAYSPVLVGLPEVPIYKIGSVLVALSGHRERVPSTIAHGPWSEAATGLHLRMIDSSASH